MGDNNVLGYTENIIVAFLDILGFASMIEQKDSMIPYVMEKLESSKEFTDSLEMQKLHKKGDWIENKREYIEIVTNKRLSVLSDSIVISYPFRNPKRMVPIIEDLRNIQLELLTMGILLRGSVTIGDLYHKDDIIYGPALLKAVYLEDQEAIYPRIIIDNDLYKLFTKTDDKEFKDTIECMFIDYPEDDYNPAIDFLSKGAFNDYYNFNQIENKNIKHELYRIKKNILSEYIKIRNDYSIRRKHDWFIKYYNYSLEKNDYGLNKDEIKDLKIDKYRLRA